MTHPVILASGSKSRRALLAAAGVKAEFAVPAIDEESLRTALRAQGVSVRDQAMQLAEMKAVRISSRLPGLVIGCDQMLSLDGEPFDKPADMASARNHLLNLSGRTHVLETAVAICEAGQIIWRHLARPKLTMRPLSDDFIDTYLQTCGTDLLSTVGAYQLEGIGIQLFQKIEGDYFSVLGLPLLPILDYLRLRGVLSS